MNRREFLTGGIAIAATAALPGGAAAATAGAATAGAATAPKRGERAFFARRGKYERMSLSYGHVHIGLEKPFSVLHVSDTHLAEAYDHEGEIKLELRETRNVTFGGEQETALADTIAWAKQNVDFIVHTGDLIDFQSEANFDLVKKHFGGAFFGSLGNHEFGKNMWLGPKEKRDVKEEWFKDSSRELLSKIYPFDISLQSNVANGVNFVSMDDVYGTVTARQVERFDAEVKKGLPIILCMHVPFFTDDIIRTKHRYWREVNRKYANAALPPPSSDVERQRSDAVTMDFIKELKREPLLRGLLVGHEHFAFQDVFSPTATEYLTAPNFLFSGREVLFT